MKLPDRVLEIRDALLSQYPLDLNETPSPEKDEEFRSWCARFARQLVYSEPGDGWGTKRSAEGNPISKDTVANKSGGKLLIWDLFQGVGTPDTKINENPDSEDVTGQVFVAMEGTNYLGSEFPPDTTTHPPTGTELDLLIYNNHGWALSQIMDKMGIPH